ncbi:MAG: alpha/beta fold hydrolase, partial [Telluria sp.]
MNMPDPHAMASAWMSQFTNPWQSWFKLPEQGSNPLVGTPLNGMPLAGLLKDAGVSIKPDALEAIKADYMQKANALWQDFIASRKPALADRRFSSPEWQSNPLTAFHAASYLLNSEFLTALAEAVEAPAREHQKIRFAVQQMVDAMSPANFLATNPEAQQKLIDTKGESLTKGMANMLADMQKGRISQSDESAFEVGRNVATTPGQVVFENDLFQLIQYDPVTPKVHERPLLIVPPCINKFYILDLQPENSLIRHAVSEGHRTFVVSWKNAGEELAQRTWDDYIEHAAIKAISLAQEISGSKPINTLGFCIGGTILATALAVLEARGERPAASMTLLTSFLDFSDTGILDIFIDEGSV